MNTMYFTSAVRAEQYHQEQLDDYYQENNRAVCQFGGSLAREMGLSGDFDAAKFKDALYGKFAGKQWVDKPGQFANAAIDCHLAPPKSVTVMALVAGDQRIIEAHQHAVQIAMQSLEKLSFTRVTTDKVTTIEPVGKLAWASFMHETARAVDGTDPDPQLHTHSLIFNAVVCADGKLRTIDAREMLKARLEVDSLYKTQMVRSLTEMGYQIVMTETAFEIEGVSQETIREFSRRSEQIERNLAEQGLTRETASGYARHVAALEDRHSKVKGEIFVRDVIVTEWQERAAAIQALTIAQPPIRGEQQVPAALDMNSVPASDAGQSVVLNAGQAIAHALEHFTERDSVIDNPRNLVAAASHASGYTLDNGRLNKALQDAIARGDVILGVQGKIASKGAMAAGYAVMRSTGKLTTKSVLEAEQSYIQAYKNGVDARAPITDIAIASATIEDVEKSLAEKAAANGIKSDGKLTAGQRRFVETVVTSTDTIVICEGDAGTGKSTSVDAIQAIAMASGYRTLGLAPTNKAVEALRESRIETVTTKSALMSAKYWDQVDSQTIIILDEAGLVPAKDMAELIRQVNAKGARIVPTGDTKQFRSVQAGSPLSQLRAAAREIGKDVRLDEMRRGRNESMRDMHIAARDTPAESIDMLFAQANMHISSNAKKRYEKVAEIYAGIPVSERDSTLVLTGMNRDRIEINTAIRSKLGLVDGTAIDTFESKSLTAAKQCELGSYSVGDLVRFNHSSGRFNKGEIVTVAQKTPDRIVMEREQGVLEDFFPNKQRAGANVSIGRREQIEVSIGDLVRFTAADHTQKIVNGDRGEVRSAANGKLMVRLEDGREVPMPIDRPLTLRYGYCATGHSSQGLTAQSVIVHATHDDPTLDRKSWYTNITRAAERLHFVTDSFAAKKMERMRNAVSNAKQHETAHDMLKNALPTEGGASPVRHHYFGPAQGLQRIGVMPAAANEDVLDAMREARARYGEKIHVAGTEEFAKRAIRLAVQHPDLATLKYVAPEHNKLRDDLLKDMSAKAKEQSTHDKSLAKLEMDSAGGKKKNQQTIQSASQGVAEGRLDTNAAGMAKPLKTPEKQSNQLVQPDSAKTGTLVVAAQWSPEPAAVRASIDQAQRDAEILSRTKLVATPAAPATPVDQARAMRIVNVVKPVEPVPTQTPAQKPLTR